MQWEIAGIQTAAAAISIGLAPPLIGLVFDRTGSYTLALILLAVGQLVAALMFLLPGPCRFATQLTNR
jgi:cyanate permease